MYQHILLAVDGSARSLRAAEAGIALAKSLGARVHVLHVVVPLPAVPFLDELIAASDIEYVDSAQTAGKGYLTEAVERAQAAGVPCQSSLESGPRPYQVIVAAAKRLGCDLIVMGSHGWRGLDRLLMGSEAQRVVLESDMPVLIHR